MLVYALVKFRRECVGNTNTVGRTTARGAATGGEVARRECLLRDNAERGGGNLPPATSFYGPTVTQSSTSMPRQPGGRDLREKQPGVRDVLTSGKAACAFHLAFFLGVTLERRAARECKFPEKDCKGAHMSLREITREAAKAAFGSSPNLALQRGGDRH